MAIPTLALVPTGVKAGKVYSVLPETGVGDFTFTRASAATRINSAGLLEVEATGVPRLEYPLIDGVVNGCPSLLLENQATNLITYPISFPTANYWTRSGASIEADATTEGTETVTNGNFTGSATGWVLANGAVYGTNNIDLPFGGGKAYQGGIVGVVNNTYKLEYTVTANTSDSVLTLYGFSEHGASFFAMNTFVVDGTVGTHTVYLQSSASAASGVIEFRNVGGTVGAVTLDNVSCKEVQGYSSPSVDFPTSAFKLVEDTSNALHYFYHPTIGDAGIKTASFFVKAGERNKIGIRDGASGGSYVSFDLENGIILDEFLTATGTINAVADGWYKISIEQTITSALRYQIFILPNSYTSGSVIGTYQGDGTSGIYIFMAQVEQGSYATSPTLTSLTAEGTTTTRVAEVCNGAGDASTFNDSEGVLMLEAAALVNQDSDRVITISDGTNSNRVTLFYEQTTNTLGYNIVVGGSSQSVNIQTLIDVTSFTKVCVKYKTNDFAFWINGFELVTDTSGATFGAGVLTELAFSGGGGGTTFYSKTKQIQYFNTVLTSAELETLTSWTSFTAMANAQQYSII